MNLKNYQNHSVMVCFSKIMGSPPSLSSQSYTQRDDLLFHGNSFLLPSFFSPSFVCFLLSFFLHTPPTTLDVEKLDQLELSAIFDAADVDGTGQIAYAEFLAATLDTSVFLREDRLRDAFNLLDEDSSGTSEYFEFFFFCFLDFFLFPFRTRDF